MGFIKILTVIFFIVIESSHLLIVLHIVVNLPTLGGLEVSPVLLFIVSRRNDNEIICTVTDGNQIRNIENA